MATALDEKNKVLLRPLRKSDRAALVKAAEELSERTRYNRFHASGIRLTEDHLNCLTDIDQDRHVARVVLDPDTKESLAIGRYVRDQDQHHGLAKVLLLGALTASAHVGGVKRFHGTYLARNLPMRQLLTSLGAKLDVNETDVISVDMMTSPVDVLDSPSVRMIRDVAEQVSRSPWFRTTPLYQTDSAPEVR